VGFSASSDLLGGERLVRNVLQSADVGEAVALEFPHGAGTPDVKTYDKAIAEMTLMRMVSIGEEVVDHILSEADDAQVNVEVTRGVRQMQIRNHTGLEQSFVRSPFTLMVEVRRIRGDDVLIAYDVVGRTVWDGDYLGPARRLSHQLGLAQRQASIASGRMRSCSRQLGAWSCTRRCFRGWMERTCSRACRLWAAGLVRGYSTGR